MNPKLKTREEISKISEELKEQGKTVVATNGSFDLMHIGHVKSLQYAKAQGDVLIVGLNSDKSVKSYKGEERPIISEEFRADMLAALECIDYVTVFDEKTGEEFVRSVKPNVFCNGEEYGENCVEAPIVKEHGGRVHVLKYIEGFSSTELMNKILRIYGEKGKADKKICKEQYISERWKQLMQSKKEGQ